MLEGKHRKSASATNHDAWGRKYMHSKTIFVDAFTFVQLPRKQFRLEKAH
jgi:hypothetical protein